MDTDTVAALRLTSRSLNIHFTKFLFRTSRLRFSVWYIVRLTWVSQRPELAQSVRELIFDTATHQTFTDVDMVEHTGLSGLERGSIARRQLAIQIRAASRDEAMALNREQQFMWTVPAALNTLTKCRRLTVTSWSGPGSTFFNRDAMQGSGRCAPPPLAPLMASEFPSMVVCFKRGKYATKDPSPTLRRLRLEIAMDSVDTEKSFKRAVSSDILELLWYAAANIRELDLEVRVKSGLNSLTRVQGILYPLSNIFSELDMFKHLCKVTLRSMWLDPKDLAAFVITHKSTLQQIQLIDMNLRGTAGFLKRMQQVIHYLDVPEFSELGTLLGGGSDGKLPWMEVMQACRDVQDLRALAISGASVSLQRTRLCEDDCIELVEVGMNGRANLLATPGWWSMWETESLAGCQWHLQFFCQKRIGETRPTVARRESFA
nr:hypothetical protein B0A51_07455 [Rachicladosporium sp. CCFEE 5018]